MGLPPRFCWTKYGAEAGEAPASILRRKECERVANGGTFLWGIGNSIRPSLLALLDIESEPQVLFTPMRSKPALKDTSPAVVGKWRQAVGVDGRPWEVPASSLVTSGIGAGQPMRHRHFALVCQRDEPLGLGQEDWLDDGELRNLRTGSVVGASQVTSVVRHVPVRERRRRYTVTFQATLVYPYLVVLSGWCPVTTPGQSRLEVSDRLRDLSGV